MRCYAAYERKKKHGDDFQPTLKVSTKNLGDKIEIKIATTETEYRKK